MCVFKLLNKGGVISKNIEPNLYKKINMEYKHLKGEIDSVIQAKNEDKLKYPKQYHLWTYEVALCIDDPNEILQERP